ncbi:MAG: hypothetical protein ACD_39C00627G0001, partial [uncultured bacterium]
MMQTRKHLFLIMVMILTLACTGCFDTKDKDSGSTTPTSFVTLNGTLTAPAQIESSLLGNALQNTDSQVRSRFK